ncbi:Bug family tripartite tricarboxylate transporter substrate binding protein [Paracraurococcus lichenis]|uniref:Tripartite tricarboxylate transporter substrate-binding protein n=1 Tax=Paracraurococcus lichenis TaxID=3064888 RepID=A0ABT9E5X2_9PROT|nr:tripartite tricarboxylate transporter substrate-binding protein [Paracraurococcus sp. LOR1-02]MDO9711566.1 tripartite tricarboxylate transporter substrate-binding protein [Paracraurococcus sp. LOR1-02]
MALGRRDAGLLALAAALGAPSILRAQAAWPDRPVRLLLPFGAGGAADTLARSLASAFAPQANGQSLVVENRGGAGGTIAGAATAQAKPDGYTLMLADLGVNAIARELQPSVPYDPATAFTPVCHLVNLPLAFVVPAALPVADIQGFVALARKRGDMVYAHPGIGYAGHLAQEFMNRELGLRMTPVPYRSGAEVARSLLSAETESTFMTVSTSLPFIREGKVKALAVSSKAPVPQLPGVPPVAAVLPGFEAMVWHGILGPAGMPEEVTAAANRIFNAVLAEPAVREAAVGRQAAEIVGGTPEQFGTFIRGEIARWTPLIRALGLRAE